MTDTYKTDKPFCTMYDTSQQLRDKAMFAHRQAATGAERARKKCGDIADLDMDGVFASLHKMVDLVGGKSRLARPTAPVPVLQAAE